MCWDQRKDPVSIAVRIFRYTYGWPIARETRHLPASGIPCRKHRCVKCCLETRMPLSNLDLKRILKLGYRLEYFAVKTEKGLRLKNSSGRCVFLQQEGCRIYQHRPEGCRLYPIVYDEALKEAVIDSICPHSYEFKVQRNDVERLESLIRRILDAPLRT